jgi:5-enolpyruvylshikimate-3-phosphate synthase
VNPHEVPVLDLGLKSGHAIDPDESSSYQHLAWLCYPSEPAPNQYSGLCHRRDWVERAPTLHQHHRFRLPAKRIANFTHLDVNHGARIAGEIPDVNSDKSLAMYFLLSAWVKGGAIKSGHLSSKYLQLALEDA